MFLTHAFIYLGYNETQTTDNGEFELVFFLAVYCVSVRR